MSGDLILEIIVSEIIGVAITVFLVGRLIQKREDARWLPSKQFLYSRLIPHFDNVLWITAPFLMSGNKYIYEFGNAVATTLEVNIDFSNQVTTQEVWSKMNNYLSEISLDQKISLLKSLSIEKEEIDKILASSVVLIEPLLSSNLMNLQETLSRASGYVSGFRLEGKLQPKNDELAAFMYTVAESAHKSKAWVIGKATNKHSTQEFVLKLVEMAQKQESTRSKNG
jgi:hypothetical protein